MRGGSTTVLVCSSSWPFCGSGPGDTETCCLPSLQGLSPEIRGLVGLPEVFEHALPGDEVQHFGGDAVVCLPVTRLRRERTVQLKQTKTKERECCHDRRTNVRRGGRQQIGKLGKS